MATPKRSMDKLTLEGRELDEMYRKYLSSYGNKQKTLKQEYGIKMWMERYTKDEFKALYEANARTMMMEKGWNKVNDKVVIREMVNKQSTELTEKQALAFQKGMKDLYNEHYTMKDIHQMAPDKIKEMYDKLLEDGITDSYERKAIISSAFFGSPS